jgi:hypothetical protein
MGPDDPIASGDAPAFERTEFVPAFRQTILPSRCPARAIVPDRH